MKTQSILDFSYSSNQSVMGCSNGRLGHKIREHSGASRECRLAAGKNRRKQKSHWKIDHNRVQIGPPKDRQSGILIWNPYPVCFLSYRIEAIRLSESPETQSAKVKQAFEPAPENAMLRLEAVLFLSRKPLTTRKISQLAGLEDGTQARTMIGQLNERYQQFQRAFHVKRIAGGYLMLTRPQFFDWINRLQHSPSRIRLSNPALETLTVIAYRQPIIKADIEAIRGVSCGEMLRQLLEKGLVKIAGRSEDLGRPFLYATTKQFLTEFGYNNTDNLPQYQELSGAGLPDWGTEVEEHDEDFDEDDDQDDEEFDDEEFDDDEFDDEEIED